MRRIITVAAFVALSALMVAAAVQTGEGDGVRRVTPAEARAAVEKGQAVIVDVRGEDSFKAGHIKGALWIPVGDIAARAGELPRGKTIITYCS
ncbi:MAG TPA: rhodanese-like domain-containing protein [Pyrinomonadaceae bacterium]|nr:rhodanese-like domain-containing protein [Pyrinomonadaceae bacterium]